jgi:hypothetical protein
MSPFNQSRYCKVSSEKKTDELLQALLPLPPPQLLLFVSRISFQDEALGDSVCVEVICARDVEPCSSDGNVYHWKPLCGPALSEDAASLG